MKNVVITFSIIYSLLCGQTALPSEFWISYTQEEKISFINGAYGAISKLKAHHRSEVRKQYMHDDNWVEPYYIERFYEIADEYLNKATIGKLNVDHHPSIASEYGIRSIPCLLFFKDGKVEKQIVGAVDKTEIASILDSL